MDVTLGMVLAMDVALGVDLRVIMALKIHMRKHLGVGERVSLRERSSVNAFGR